MKCIEPILAAAYYRTSVDLCRRSVNLGLGLRSSEYLLKNLVGIRHEHHKESSGNEDNNKHYEYRNENGGYR